VLNYKKIFQPRYFNKFKCIGKACEDTCCSGWTVHIDKSTYTKYRKCRDTELKPMLDKKVTRNRTNASNTNYAKIVLSQMVCPFLTEEHLCCIQKKLGEAYLSVTCATYPRSTRIVNGVVERALSVSCPEVTRLALLNRDVMEFEEINNVDNIHIGEETKVIDTCNYKRSSKPYQYFWELRGFTIFILQSRTYPLWQRLIILGLFYDQLNQNIEGKEDNIPELISTYSERINKGVFHEALDGIPNQPTMQLRLLSTLIELRVNRSYTTERFLECLDEFSQGIQSISESSQEESDLYYAEAYSQYYKPFMDQHEYILENYLVNYVFLNLFPFGSRKDIYDEYVLLAIHFAIIKNLLIGLAGYHKTNFGIAHVVKLIQSFSKAVEHNSTYLKYVVDFFEENDLKNSACMAILIKN
jgi:lysine-N-methylase